MIVGVDMPGDGGEDRGADRDKRPKPCVRMTWCIDHADHEGVCVLAARSPLPPTDFGPRAAVNTRRRT